MAKIRVTYPNASVMLLNMRDGGSVLVHSSPIASSSLSGSDVDSRTSAIAYTLYQSFLVQSQSQVQVHSSSTAAAIGGMLMYQSEKCVFILHPLQNASSQQQLLQPASSVSSSTRHSALTPSSSASSLLPTFSEHNSLLDNLVLCLVVPLDQPEGRRDPADPPLVGMLKAKCVAMAQNLSQILLQPLLNLPS